MNSKALRLLVGAAATAMAFPASGQECRAALKSQPPAWSDLQTPAQPDNVRMKSFVENVCKDCEPQTVIEVFAGTASEDFRRMRIAQKTGTAFAEAVLADKQDRSDFLDATLAAERHVSPGCVLGGQIDGVSAIGGLGMIVANARAECSDTPQKLRVVLLSGYDGQCLYRVRVMWSGWEGLSVSVQDQVLAVFEQIRFGP